MIVSIVVVVVVKAVRLDCVLVMLLFFGWWWWSEACNFLYVVLGCWITNYMHHTICLSRNTCTTFSYLCVIHFHWLSVMKISPPFALRARDSGKVNVCIFAFALCYCIGKWDRWMDVSRCSMLLWFKFQFSFNFYMMPPSDFFVLLIRKSMCICMHDVW